MVLCMKLLGLLKSRYQCANNERKEVAEKCGVSVYHLKTVFLPAAQQYVQENEEIKKHPDDATIYDICDGVIKAKGKYVICPRDNKLGAAYVDCLVGNDHVGEANVMLSYGWLNKARDIVSVLEKYCSQSDRDPKHTYVWICCLCNNQYRIQDNDSVTFEELQKVFQDKVIGIGNVVALMSPWNDPIYLKRVWCIFEFYKASSNSNVNLKIFMPPEEENDMIKVVVLGDIDDMKGTGGINDLYNALNNTNIEEAGATIQKDKENILQLVKTDCGIENLNVSVNDKLRRWVSDIIHEFKQKELQSYHDDSTDMDLARNLHNIASVYDDQGQYENAFELYNKCLVIYKNVLGEDHLFTTNIYNNIASVLQNQGRYQEALAWYEKACIIEENELGEMHPSTATTFHNMASVYYSQGKYMQSQRLYQKSCIIREQLLGMEHPSTAATYNNLGLVCDSQGNHEEALQWYTKCCIIREKILGEDHPSTVTTYHNMASVFDAQGEYDRAYELYDKCRKSNEITIGEQHPSTATTYGKMGGVCQRQGNYEEALMWYHKCCDIRGRLLGEDHPSTAIIYNNIASVYVSQSKYDDALEFYLKCYRSKQKAFGEKHISTASTNFDIASLYEKQGKFEEA